jgi:asparagine synthase (glutamine-hydrolysing)
MCGLAGFLDLQRRWPAAELAAHATRMADALRSRGPDDGQVWVDEAAGMALGFRRLAIMDLSEAGRQPMHSADRRYVIAYNGEVYNATELRQELAARGARFRGHSDTEVILAACSAWGVEAAVRRFIGMFAIALWDREAGRLTLIRDRLGIKPLYWGRFGEVLLFGSQPKALFGHPAWRGELDRDSVAAFSRFGHVPKPWSIFKDLRQLAPGRMVTIDAAGGVREAVFWDAHEVVGRASARRLALSDAEALDQLEALLKDAIRRRMLADVPLGAFLSGGVDSSTVVALMQTLSNRPVKTFSIGFAEPGYDEAPYARAVAEHLKTDHHELYVAPAHALEVIPKLPEWYDEPFADSSQIPTFLVSELARRHVTVSLSGDGGDELFAGYARYQYVMDQLGGSERVPGALRPPLRLAARALSPAAWNRLARWIPYRWRPQAIGERIHRLAHAMDPAGFERTYLGHMTYWPAGLVPDSAERLDAAWHGSAARILPDPHERMQFIDLVNYLPNDILTKVDRASMAIGLEARVPLIDHRVVELCWRLPKRMKVRDGVTKWALRQVLYRHVPRELIERPKMGFGVPIDAWLRGPLRDWAEDLLSEARLRREGTFDPKPIRQRWQEHLEGRLGWHYWLWPILMFQAWKQHWRIA